MSETTVYRTGAYEHAASIRWGAVIAALFFVVAAGWLLFALGSAIGISVADASDLQAMGQGLGIGAVVWLILSALVVFFLGGLLAARLSGNADREAGMLHGLVLWSVATALALVLGAMTLGALWRAGESLASGAAQAAQGIGSGVVQGGQAAANATDSPMAAIESSPVLASLQAQLKREAGEVLAQQRGLSEQEARTAIEQIDAEVLQQMAAALVRGDTAQARDVLTVNTTLSEDQIRAIADGLSDEVQTRVDELRAQAQSALETASNYAQALMWTEFVMSLLGLVLAVVGGAIGASRVPRSHAETATVGHRDDTRQGV